MEHQSSAMTHEAIILAGGFGTRLADVVDVPKPMAPVNGKPFLQYILDYLIEFQVTIIHLAVGYKHKVIMDYFGNRYQNLSLHYIIEDTPLGTGGAVKKALESVSSGSVFVLNGDTFYNVDLWAMTRHFMQKNAFVNLALKPLENFDRYGVVELDKDEKITAFKEKKYRRSGLINGGIYLLKEDIFRGLDFPDQFSLEKDYFDAYAHKRAFYGFISDGYFIDIGIPADYTRAQKELPGKHIRF